MNEELDPATTEKPSIVRMAFRGFVFLIAPTAVMLSLLAAIIMLPESEYFWLWESSFAVLAFAALLAFIVIKTKKK